MRLLLVIMGASEWPEFPTLRLPSEQFGRSAYFAADLFRDKDVHPADIYWAFNDPRSASDQDRLLGQWLAQRTRDTDPLPPTDLVVYFVGHGTLANGELHLVVRATREENIEQTCWSCNALARTLHRHAPAMRKHVILDCCHAAAGVKNFQAEPDRAGVAVLCAVASYDLAIAPPTELLTAFSRSLFTAVTRGAVFAAERVSLAELHASIHADLAALGMPTPSIWDAEQRGERVSARPLVVNRAHMKNGDAHLPWQYSFRILELEATVQRRLISHVDAADAKLLERVNEKVAEADAKLLQRVKNKVAVVVDQASREVLAAANRSGVKRAVKVLVPLWLGIAVLTALLYIHVLRELASPKVPQPLELTVLNPALGWQAGPHVVKGEHLCIRSDGRINLGLNQIVNVMNASRSIIADYAPHGSATQRIATAERRHEYDKDTFRRPWTNASGSFVTDLLLDDARLSRTCHWGELMAVVIGNALPSLAADDPLAVMKRFGLQEVDIACVGALDSNFAVERDGVLAFIVNDAVASNAEPGRTRSVEIYDALLAASMALPAKSGGLQVLDRDSLPLFWYADNGGQLTIIVTHGACAL